MKIFVLIGFLPLLAFSNPIFEKRVQESCSKYINLTKSNWLNFRPVPTLDQGPVGLCYAYSATTLMDLFRDIHGLKIGRMSQMPSNPIWSAMLYYNNKRSVKSLSGGQGQEVIEQVRKFGMCRADVIDKAMSQYARTNNITTRDWYVLAEWFFEFYNSSIEKELKSATNKEEKLKEIFSRFTGREKIADLYKNGDFSKIYNSLKPFLAKKDILGLLKTVFADCFKPGGVYVTSKNLPPIKSKFGKFRLEMEITKQLDQKNPVLLTYQANVLRKQSSLLQRFKNFITFANHQSVIVGKRVRNNKCQFLLKNTWGNYCNYGQWECFRDSKRREAGVWINANDLMKATIGIHYFNLSKKMKRFK